MAGAYYSDWKPKELLDDSETVKVSKQVDKNEAEESESTKPDVFYDNLEFEAEIRKK